MRSGSDCWWWTGKISRKTGYGGFWDGESDISTHRYAYRYAFGAIPDGLHVLHDCDNPPCVNPHHLYAGSPADNAHDASERLRLRHGEEHHKAKLNADQVRQIRAKRAAGETCVSVAEQFGCAPTLVSMIEHRQIWRHIA